VLRSSLSCGKLELSFLDAALVACAWETTSMKTSARIAFRLRRLRSAVGRKETALHLLSRRQRQPMWHLQPTGGTVLMGGGTDVDAAFQWMCGLAGNGDFLVIRATGTDAYNPYIQELCPAANSVATLIIPSAAAANDPNVAAIMQSAEAIWIAGGDQSNYINFWTGAPVQSILNAKIAAGGPGRRHQRRPERADRIRLLRAGAAGRNLDPVAGRPVQPLPDVRRATSPTSRA